MFIKVKEVLLRFRAIKKVRDCLLYIRDYWKNHEIKKKYGELNPDKTIYIIRNYTKEAGWGSIHNYVLLNIEYAIEKGWYPVVDMQNYPNAYLCSRDVGKVNSWDLFFKQPVGISLEDAYRSKNVILCGTGPATKGYYGAENLDIIRKYSEIIEKYMIVNEEVKKEIDEEKKKLFGNNKRVLGVVCRGTDYLNLKPAYHSIPYSKEDILHEIRERIDDYDLIYLATEDLGIFDFMKKELPKEKLVFTSQDRFEATEVKGYLSDTMDRIGIDKKKKGMDYLKIIYLLSECTSLLCPIVGGSITAIRINGAKYEECKFLKRGTYGE